MNTIYERALDFVHDGATVGLGSGKAASAFIRLLGASEVEDNRTAMPWHLLIDSSGRELGRAVGLMTGSNGGYTYFEDDATFEFLRGLS